MRRTNSHRDDRSQAVQIALMGFKPKTGWNRSSSRETVEWPVELEIVCANGFLRTIPNETKYLLIVRVSAADSIKGHCSSSKICPTPPIPCNYTRICITDKKRESIFLFSLPSR